MYAETLPKNWEKILTLLKSNNLLQNFYLAGGTGLALQIGHRTSIDFDFFSDKTFNTRHYLTRLKNTGNFTLINEDKGTVNGILNDTKISFFHYDYPLLWDLKSFKNIKIADIFYFLFCHNSLLQNHISI